MAGKKRKAEAARLEETDRALYGAFRGAANSLSQLYTLAMGAQKASFHAGERHAMVRPRPSSLPGSLPPPLRRRIWVPVGFRSPVVVEEICVLAAANSGPPDFWGAWQSLWCEFLCFRLDWLGIPMVALPPVGRRLDLSGPV